MYNNCTLIMNDIFVDKYWFVEKCYLNFLVVLLDDKKLFLVIIIIFKKIIITKNLYCVTNCRFKLSSAHLTCSNRETRDETNLSLAYSWNLTKRLSYYVILWEGSSMQPELRNRSCGSWIFSCVLAGLVVGQKWKIEGRHVRVVRRQALCIGGEVFGGQGMLQ